MSGFFHTIGRGQQRPRFLKTNNMKEKNDCYECPHRREISGSAHIACNIGMITAIRFIRAHQEGNMPTEFTNNETGDLMLQFDPHGLKMGWCTWPVNFDPVWVECYLPIEKKDV